MKEVKETVSGEDSNWNQSKRKREPHRAGVGRGVLSLIDRTRPSALGRRRIPWRKNGC